MIRAWWRLRHVSDRKLVREFNEHSGLTYQIACVLSKVFSDKDTKSSVIIAHPEGMLNWRDRVPRNPRKPGISRSSDSPDAGSRFPPPEPRIIAPIVSRSPQRGFNYRKIGRRENNQRSGESLSNGQIALRSSADSRLIMALCQDQLPSGGSARSEPKHASLDVDSLFNCQEVLVYWVGISVLLSSLFYPPLHNSSIIVYSILNRKPN